MENNRNINDIVEDLIYIKNAINKSNNIFKFISLSKILRRVYLIGAALIIGFSGIFYYFIQNHGSYEDIPSSIKGVIYFLMAVSIIVVAYTKTTIILKAAKKINRNITVSRLFNEVYTAQFTLVILPYFAAIFTTIAFLVKIEFTYYIVPFISIFLGLLFNSLLSVFYMREMMILGGWLVLIGSVTILGLISLHPLLIIILSFGVGFVISYIASFVTSPS